MGAMETISLQLLKSILKLASTNGFVAPQEVGIALQRPVIAGAVVGALYGFLHHYVGGFTGCSSPLVPVNYVSLVRE